MGNWGEIAPISGGMKSYVCECVCVCGKHLKPEIRMFQPAYHVFSGYLSYFWVPMFLVILDLPPVESEGVFRDSLVKNVIFLVGTVTGSRGRSNAYICLFVIPTDTL